jgi:hypothetical protein
MNTLTQDAIALREKKQATKKLKDDYEQSKREFEDAQQELLDRMEAEECEGVKADGTNFVPSGTVFAQVTDRAEFVAWAEQNDESLIEPKERKELLNQLVRECQDNGQPLPPGVTFYIKSYVSQRAT